MKRRYHDRNNHRPRLGTNCHLSGHDPNRIDGHIHNNNSNSLLRLLLLSTLTFAFLDVLEHIPTTAATVTLLDDETSSAAKYYKSYEEQRFGHSLAHGVEYIARLQYLKGGDSSSGSGSGDNGGGDDGGNGNSGGGGFSDAPVDEFLCSVNSTSVDDIGMVVPTDGLPVVLLARTGKCTVQQKAIVASRLLPANIVRHLIVYDMYDDESLYYDDDGVYNNLNEYHLQDDLSLDGDENDDDDDDDDENNNNNKSIIINGDDNDDDAKHRPTETEPNLTPLQLSLSLSLPLSSSPQQEKRRTLSDVATSMFSLASKSASMSNDDAGDKIIVSVLYISGDDGKDLIQRLHEQSQYSYERGGPRLLLDGYDNWVPPAYDNDITPMDVLTLIALMLLCCMTLSCLFSTANLASAGIVVFDGQTGNNNGNNDEDLLPGRYRHGLRLLNREEVLSLPEIVYNSSTHGRYINGGGGDESKPIITNDGTMICIEESVGDGGEEESIEAISLCDMNTNSGNISLVSSDNDSLTAGSASPTSRSPTSGGLSPFSESDQDNHPEELYHDGACTICLEEYKDGDKLRVLPCQHAFHSDCILPWLTDRAPTCPLCKALLEVEREGDEEHRQMLQQRRQAAEEGEEGNGLEEGLSAIPSGDAEEGGTNDRNHSGGSNQMSMWRSWFRGHSPTEQQDDLDHQLNEEQEIELPQQEGAADHLGRRSNLVRALTPTWRILFQRSDDQNEQQNMREPLLDGERNRESEEGSLNRLGSFV